MNAVSEVRDVPVGELHLWDRNPRRITDAAMRRLVRSLAEDPAMLAARPVIALPDGRVFAGNMRLLAARELGWTTIPTVYADIDSHRATTWALRDNNPYGEWEHDALVELLAELEEASLDLELTGFSQEELDELLASVDGADSLPDDRGTDLAVANVSIGDPEHEVEAGDTWRVGDHVLVVAKVYDGWPEWTHLLQPGDLLVPYPTPTVPLSTRAGRQRLVMVQPDPWLAGHLLDKYAAVRGDDAVGRL